MEKRFYRSRTDKKLAGVCAGIANYFEIDPTLVRLIWIVFTFAGGTGILAYIIAAIIMPEEPFDYFETRQQQYQSSNNQTETADVYEVDDENTYEGHEKLGESEPFADSRKQSPRDNHRHSNDRERNNMTVGAILILIGVMFFSRNFFRWYWIDFSYLWPAILILIGVVMLVNKRK
ncbi:PspC domain-containing protein [Anoxynatronum buryatiense]|uniref:Phage shock protein C (PspC) family protein n=1 Tax=Anoxynatronum buryatiense TaxID=489973 RepID=A0AA45WUL7_9CLOT|nr:PspC domain-containing protein [Anoxynatronum buryatiense]SMP48117.1 phage shock protein C (PspC) family protein [Anoxynatronum buryatiense]